MTATKTKAKTGTVATGEPTTTQALVPHAPPDTPAAIFEALDRADEELIVAEIVEGTLVDKLAYEFEAGGNKVRGLSYSGVNWCVREMAVRRLGRIRLARDAQGKPCVTVIQTVDPDGNPVYEATVVAEDQMLGTENAGLADAELYPSKKGGGTYTDRHAKRKAVSKAQRNAKAGLIPELLKAELLAKVTSAQLQIVQTRRQEAEGQAKTKSRQRASQATAEKPNRETPASAAQQRMLCAKAKGAETDPDGPEFKALLGWVGGTVHLDKYPKAKVPVIVEILDDGRGRVEQTLADIRDAATSDHPDGKAAEWLVTEVLDKPAAGEQGRLG